MTRVWECGWFVDRKGERRKIQELGLDNMVKGKRERERVIRT